DCVAICTNKGQMIFDRVIIATGGCSYPLTGSTGDGYRFAVKLGHSVIPPKAALCELPLKESVSSLEGLSLKNVQLNVYVDGKAIFEKFGEALFTESGLSGPIALTASSIVNKYAIKDILLELDLKPALCEFICNKPSIEERLLNDFAKYPKRELKNICSGLFPDRLADYVLAYCGLNGNLQSCNITSAQRKTLAHTVKHLRFTLAKEGNIEHCVVTSGGVCVDEINPRSMQSKICGRVFWAGEVIDVDAFTGGFNMQIAFATGYAAGLHSASGEER
ncbi:MAG: aminoacetone oxidase family FAD-binding enzyme, partial [Corallococcus sp.]|nr:aminoacetone oxidase family FAD-binding enzyme [Corallococcus sp.]